MATKIEQPDTRDADDPTVVEWRRSRLVAAGFPDELAEELAHTCAADLHALIELVERGCPPPLAARILAPLDGEAHPC